MYHWDRGISCRLQRVSTPVEQGCEVSVHSEQMDPLPEEQQNQQGAPINPTTYMSSPDSRSDPIGGSEPSLGCETQDWDSLPNFFLKAVLVPMGMAHII